MDKLYERVGAFGRYQKVILLAIGMCTGLVGFTTYSSIFANAKPEIICNRIGQNMSNLTLEENQCDILSRIEASTMNGTDPEYECHYDDTYYGVTLITELGLVCQKTYMANLTQTIFMIGCFFTFFVGYFSDKFGRQKVLLIVVITANVFLFLCSILEMDVFNFSVNTRYAIYAVSMFFLGNLTYVVEIVSYVLALELTTPKYHAIVSIIYLNMYVLGEYYVLIIYYLSRNWHVLYWCVSGYSLIITGLVVFVIPESPRILAANQRYDAAAKVLNKIAKFNGKDIKKFTGDEIESELNQEKKLQENTMVTVANKNASAWYYLTHPWKNMVRFLLMAYVWIAISMVYFGVSLGITSISSNLNPYVMFFLSSAAEIVGYTAGIVGVKFPRNPVLRICLFIAAVCCIVVAFIPVTSSDYITWNAVLIMICVFLGKAMSSTAFNLIYVYTNQLYPTYVRNTLVSIIASAGRFGSIISPQINLLGDVAWGPLPYLIFSASTFIACVFLFFIPNPPEELH